MALAMSLQDNKDITGLNRARSCEPGVLHGRRRAAASAAAFIGKRAGSAAGFTHLIVCRKRTRSLISSGILLRMCFRALAFSFRSWNSCSGRSIMNSAENHLLSTFLQTSGTEHTSVPRRAIAPPRFQPAGITNERERSP